jgi:hypothetical protein
LNIFDACWIVLLRWVIDPAGVIIAIATFKGNVYKSDSPWFQGPIGWELGEVVAIDPVPCTGRQGLWTPPDEVMHQVRVNYANALKQGAKTKV